MKKLISTITVAAFTAVCSLGAAAASDSKDKNKETMGSSSSSQPSKGDRGSYGKEPSSTSEIMKEQMPKDLGPGVKDEYRDQEVMNKKPYKQTK